MPLHPFESRNKRLENALTGAGLFAVLLGLSVFMTYDGERLRWDRWLGEFAYLIVVIPAAIISAYFYVRGGKAK